MVSGPHDHGDELPKPRRAAGLDARTQITAAGEVTLVDLLDRLLQGGVAIQGDITLAAAGVDLVALDLRVLVAAVDTVAAR